MGHFGGENDDPVFRVTSPLSRGQLKSKAHGKLSMHYSADLDTMKTVVRIVFAVNQLSLCGAIANMCEEFESFPDRKGRLVVMGQSSSSLVLSVIKTQEVLLDYDDLARKDLQLQQYGERIEKFSQDKFKYIVYGCRIF